MRTEPTAADRGPQRLRATTHFARLTARLLGAPLQNKRKAGLFPQSLEPCPYRGPCPYKKRALTQNLQTRAVNSRVRLGESLSSLAGRQRTITGEFLYLRDCGGFGDVGLRTRLLIFRVNEGHVGQADEA